MFQRIGGRKMANIFNHIIQSEKIEHVYQPLWNLNNWKIFGFEALVRFKNGCFLGKIEDAFEQARKEGLMYELDTMSIFKAISSFPFNPHDGRLLFINVFPSTLVNKKFECFIEKLRFNFPNIKGRIVFEINESQQEEHIWKDTRLRQGISLLKEKDFFVAFDDVGKGAATLRKIVEFSPNCIKLDRHFAKDLYASKDKQRVISQITQFSKDKMVVILEGIENEIDLAMAKMLKVPVAQGYLLGRPEKINEQYFI